MMRFERLWGTERIFDWPLEFCLNICGFWEPLVLAVDLPRELICSLYSHFRPKAVGCQGLDRTTVRVCPPHALELSSFRTEGMFLVRLFLQWLTSNFPGPRGTEVCCTLWKTRLLFVVSDYQIHNSLQRNSIQWIARKSRGVTTDIHTTKPRKLPINFKAEAHKF